MPILELKAWQILVLLIPLFINTWGIWHVFTHSFASSAERMIWAFVCIFVPLAGGIIYLLFGFRRATGKTKALFIEVQKDSEKEAQNETIDTENGEKTEENKASQSLENTENSQKNNKIA